MEKREPSVLEKEHNAVTEWAENNASEASGRADREALVAQCVLNLMRAGYYAGPENAVPSEGAWSVKCPHCGAVSGARCTSSLPPNHARSVPVRWAHPAREVAYGRILGGVL